MDEFEKIGSESESKTEENPIVFTKDMNTEFDHMNEINSENIETPMDAPVEPIFPDTEKTVESENIETPAPEKKKDKKFAKAIAVALIVSLVGGSTIGIGFGAGSELAKNYLKKSGKSDFSFSDSASGQTNATETNSAGNVSAEFLSGGLSGIVKKVKPSVVCITTVSTASQEYSFFGSSEDIEGAGSGIIFEDDDEKVYIVTNAHVITGANSVGVAIGDSEPVEAKLVGRDTASDLAVIYVKKADLEKVGVTEVTKAKFSDNAGLEVGDMVLAIGNALGEGNTSTFGMISALDKDISVEGKELNVIQTDAAINFGNSGGALVNLKGEVIGINTAKISKEYAEGMGYSISTKIAMPIIEELINGEEKAFLGIKGRTLDEELAAQFNLVPAGVFVYSVTDGGSAAKAGIKANDIITSFNGKTIFTMESLQEVIKGCKVGQSAEVKILRNGESMTINVTLEAYPDTAF